MCKGVNQHECARSSRLGERPYPRGRRPASLQLGAPVPQSRAISYASLPSTPVIVTAPSAEQSHSTRMECSRSKRVTTDSVAGSACLKTTRTRGRRTGRAERGRGVHHLRGVGRGERAVERCRQGVTGRYRRGHPRRLANGDVSAARRCCGHASTSARASCATRRASCSGTGVRAAGVDETSTIWAAVSGLVRHPAWATSGRAPVRVHTQKATQRSSKSSGAMAPRRSSGSVPPR